MLSPKIVFLALTLGTTLTLVNSWNNNLHAYGILTADILELGHDKHL